MFDKLSSKNIWVNAKAVEGGNGSYESPFSKIQTAINSAMPGSTIVLLPGIYDEKLVVQDLLGVNEEPITIAGFKKNAEDIISHAEWYFYSTTDIIVKEITFRQTLNSAISIIGESKRISVKNCVFDQCGEVSENAVFLGGSGGDSNVIENCDFSAPKLAQNHIAVMICQSVDTDNDEEKTTINSKNTSVRFCRFKNCRTAVVVGSDENICALFGGHEIFDNLFDHVEIGVKTKISGTQICGNIFRNSQTAIINSFGSETEIFENRFEACKSAISVACDDITIEQNCFIDSKISVEPNLSLANPDEIMPILISQNTFVSKQSDEIVILSPKNSMAVIAKNIFYNCEILDNNISEADNLFEKDDIFAGASAGDFSTNTDYGCSSVAKNRLEIDDIPLVDIVEMFEAQENQDSNTSTDRELSPILVEKRDLFIKSIVFEDDDEESEEIEFEAISVGQQGLRPIGIDGELEDN